MYIGPLGMENFQNKSRHILLCPRTKSKQTLELGVLSIIPTAQICNNAIFYEICKQKKIYDLLSTFLTFTLKKKHRAVEILLQMKPDSFLQLRQKKLLVYIYAVTGSASLSLSFFFYEKPHHQRLKKAMCGIMTIANIVLALIKSWPQKARVTFTIQTTNTSQRQQAFICCFS